MDESFVVVDPDLPEDIARLILTVPADLLPDPLAADLPERAAWAGAPPKKRGDGDSYRWLRYGAGWDAARFHRGGYVVLPPSASPDIASELAARIRQAAEALCGADASPAAVAPDHPWIGFAVPREVFDIASVMQEAHADDWPALAPLLGARIEQLEGLARQVLRADRLGAGEQHLAEEPEPYRTSPAELAARAARGSWTGEVAALTARTREVVEILGAGTRDGDPVQESPEQAEALSATAQDVVRLADRLAASGDCPAAEQLLRQAAELLGQG